MARYLFVCALALVVGFGIVKLLENSRSGYEVEVTGQIHSVANSAVNLGVQLGRYCEKKANGNSADFRGCVIEFMKRSEYTYEDTYEDKLNKGGVYEQGESDSEVRQKVLHGI